MSSGDTVKRATALKRAGDLDGAIALLHTTIEEMPLGQQLRPPMYRKVIGYLIAAGRLEEARVDANRMIEEAPREATGRPEMMGTCYNAAYRERARVHLATGKSLDAFLDSVRASWFWQHAMRLQGRDRDEHTPESAVDGLEEALETCGLDLPKTRLRSLTIEGLQTKSPEGMVQLFLGELSPGK